ncbi:MAG: hypothetical protein Q4C55_01735 [Eubacterium sp.]|nr:hypothetical protein [Eubacterium sp.]
MDNNNRDKDLKQDESRIRFIEAQLLEKEEKLEQLKESSEAELSEQKREGSISDQFVPVFQREEAFPTLEEGEDREAVYSRQLAVLEAREASVKKMLESLEDVLEMLRARSDALNKKEEILNREYLKLIEIESMYKGTDRLADSLGVVLPGLGIDSGEAAEAEDERIED